MYKNFYKKNRKLYFKYARLIQLVPAKGLEPSRHC